jgi:hypothetical protein
MKSMHKVATKLSIVVLVISLIGCRPHPKPGPVSNSSLSSPDVNQREGTERICNTDAAANQVLVRFRHPEEWRDKKTLETIAGKISGDNVTVEPVGEGDVVLVHSQSGRSVAALRESFNAKQYSEIIEYAEPDYAVSLECGNPSSGNNPYIMEQWGLDKIDACDAWRLYNESDVIVAVIDSGICDYQDNKLDCHEDLKDNIWFPPDRFSVKLGGRDVTCVTGCFGFNATVADSQPDFKKWYPAEGDGHGTQVSGIMAARNNDKGVIGVSWKNKVLMVKYSAAVGYGFVSSIKRAVDFIIAASKKINIRVVNCSFGFEPGDLPSCGSETLRAAFERLSQTNMLVVTSEGDFDGVATSTHPHYPSGYNFANLISVTATDINDSRYFQAAYDPGAANLIGAPGAGVYTTQRSGYGKRDGTSFATPFVSGAAALILSDTSHGCDKLSANELRTKILANADQIGGLKQYIQYGRRLNVYNALINCDK